MELIDTHCHLDMPAFDADRQAVLDACRQQGINRIVVPAVSRNSWDGLLNLCQQEPGLSPALGLHPMFIDEHDEADLLDLISFVDKSKPLAVGEIGLDFYMQDADKERQLHFFESQCHIAHDVDLPVLLHVRKAHDQVLGILRASKVKGGIAHAFNGSLQQARQYIDMGFKLGFGGTLTYEGSKKIRQLARELPLQSIVLETDAPDMVVETHRGERNSPEYITHVLTALAEIRNMSLEEVAQQTTKNACDVLALD